MNTTLLRPAFEAWVKERSVVLSPSTMASDYWQATKWVNDSPVTELADGRNLIAWVLQQPHQPSARRVATLVKSFYNWCASDGVELLDRNPVASFRMPKQAQRDDEIVVIPREEWPLLLAAVSQRKHGSVPWELWVQFQYQTGMRTGEVRAIQIADVRGDRLLVHQNFTMTHGLKHSTKTNKRRWVPLNAVALDVISRCTPDKDGYLFPWSRQGFQFMFHKRMQEAHAAGVLSRVYRPYDLRHTAITRWLEAGVSVAQCAAWAGNTSQMIWAHYAGADNDTAIPTL